MADECLGTWFQAFGERERERINITDTVFQMGPVLLEPHVLDPLIHALQ